MDYQYTAIICILSVIAFLSAHRLTVSNVNWPLLPFCASFIGAFVMFMMGLNSNIVVSQEKRQVEVSKTFDHISLKAADWPEYFTTDFNTLEKPVNLVKTVRVNHYGLGEWTQWSYEIIPVGER